VSGYGFAFNYTTAIEHTVGNKKVIKELVPEFYDSENLVESNSDYRIADDEIAIDWTHEREQFFIDLKKNTLALCEKILKFMGKDEQQIITTIDSGMKLLGEQTKQIK
jgi:hypothetical protein